MLEYVPTGTELTEWLCDVRNLSLLAAGYFIFGLLQKASGAIKIGTSGLWTGIVWIGKARHPIAKVCRFFIPKPTQLALDIAAVIDTEWRRGFIAHSRNFNEYTCRESSCCLVRNSKEYGNRVSIDDAQLTLSNTDIKYLTKKCKKLHLEQSKQIDEDCRLAQKQSEEKQRELAAAKLAAILKKGGDEFTVVS